MATTDRTGSNPMAALAAESVRIFLRVQSAFDQSDPEIKEVVCDMMGVYNEPSATDDEKNRALLTMVDALFPGLGADFLESCEAIDRSDAAVRRRDEMRIEEANFADRVARIMRERAMTQEELAAKAGIGQPAVSNMLARQCRPQRRTVAKIAAALEVRPEELWPAMAQPNSTNET